MADVGNENQIRGPSQRMEWLDYAKAVGITLVVLGHVIRGLRADIVGVRLNDYLTLDFLIYTFHMPLFFFASGAVFGRRLSSAFRQFAGALAIGLVVPYVVWSGAFVLTQQPVSSHVNHLYDVDRLAHIWRYPIGHMWFLYALFVVQIGFYLGGRIAGVAGVAAFGGLCLASYLFPGIPFSLDRLAPGTGMGGTFFALGLAVIAAARRYRWKVQPTLLLVLGIVVWLVSAITMLKTSGFTALAPIAAAAGILMTVAACLMLPRARGPLALVALIGQASIAIYVSHTIFGAALRIFFYRIGITNCDLHVVSETIIGIALPTVLFVLANRYAISPYIGFGPTRKLQYLADAKMRKTEATI